MAHDPANNSPTTNQGGTAPPKPAKGLSGEVALMTAAGVAEQIGAIGLMIALSRILSVADYGGFRQLWLIHRSLVVLFMIGIPISLQYYLPLIVPGFRRRLVGRSLLALAASGLVAAVGVFLLADAIAQLFDNPPLADLLRLFCVYPMLVLPTQAMRAALIEMGKSVRFAVFTLIDQAVTLGLGITVAMITGRLEPLVLMLVVLGVLKVIVAVALTLWTLRGNEEEGRDGRASIGLFEQIKLSLSLSVSTAIDAINLQLDKFMVASFFSVEQFAQYANGAFHVPVVSSVVSGFSTVLLPEYVRRQQRGDTAGVLSLWHRSIRQTAILFVPMVVFLVVFAESFVTLMFSATYVDSSNIFRIYVLALLPRMTWYSYVLIALNKPREPAIGSAIALVSNVGLNVVFIYWLGVIGPAVATVISDVLVGAYFLLRIGQATATPWRAVFPWAALSKLALLSLAVVVVVLPLTFVDWSGRLDRTQAAAATLVIAGLIYALLGTLGLRLTGLITAEEWAWVKRRLLRR